MVRFHIELPFSNSIIYTEQTSMLNVNLMYYCEKIQIMLHIKVLQYIYKTNCLKRNLHFL